MISPPFGNWNRWVGQRFSKYEDFIRRQEIAVCVQFLKQKKKKNGYSECSSATRLFITPRLSYFIKNNDYSEARCMLFNLAQSFDDSTEIVWQFIAPAIFLPNASFRKIKLKIKPQGAEVKCYVFLFVLNMSLQWL